MIRKNAKIFISQLKRCLIKFEFLFHSDSIWVHQINKTCINISCLSQNINQIKIFRINLIANKNIIKWVENIRIIYDIFFFFRLLFFNFLHFLFLLFQAFFFLANLFLSWRLNSSKVRTVSILLFLTFPLFKLVTFSFVST